MQHDGIQSISENITYAGHLSYHHSWATLTYPNRSLNKYGWLKFGFFLRFLLAGQKRVSVRPLWQFPGACATSPKNNTWPPLLVAAMASSYTSQAESLPMANFCRSSSHNAHGSSILLQPGQLELQGLCPCHSEAVHTIKKAIQPMCKPVQ